MTRVVILAGTRTPIGRLSGALGSLSAAQLATAAMQEVLNRAQLEPGALDAVIMGQALPAGQGQLPGRQAAIASGVPMGVPVMMVNKVCLSGLQSIHLACLMIKAGEAQVILAGGMESMTQAPFLLPGARNGLGYGDTEMRDAIIADGLTCAFDDVPMGLSTDRFAGDSISREDLDHYSSRSHERAAAAEKRLAEEIVEVAVPQRRGDPLITKTDEGIRPETTVESLGRLRPVFDPAGRVTAGNSSQISDGAAAVVVTTLEHAYSLGVAPLGEIIGYGQVAGPTPSLLLQPANAVRDALTRSGQLLSDLSLFELNEAFASVALASQRDLGIPDEILNVNGGAIALGHPLGMSGTRLAITLAYELQRRGGGMGGAALCGGGGQGDALLLRTVE